ncbi:tRNA 2-thiouridine(34) synthase MnmA [Candidatus Azambacteria bacterium]|nr:tRNA 2-thiouridine(34) synthase MnmA [Candidatus Azambacteria bacterium]
MQKIFVAMSGGVDSSVAAALLKKEGYDVTGVFMKGWSDSRFFKDKTMCPWVADQEEARKAAAVLGIPFYTWDVQEEYKKKVVDYMVSSYREGITPNPDVMCNKEIKFGIFLDRALSMGADFIATGHYARTQLLAGGYSLFAGMDKNKDQSYFLWTLTQKKLAHVLFPIGGFIKSHVRELAREFGLSNANRKESQGVCFVGELEVFDFLKSQIAAQPGPVLTAAGKQVGKHQGAVFYTIGQRHGIGSPGGGTAYYVAQKDLAHNTLYVAENIKEGDLYKTELIARGVSWISGTAPQFPLRCEARIRYRQPLQKCFVDAALHVIFDEPQRAVTPGQSIVFYDGNPRTQRAEQSSYDGNPRTQRAEQSSYDDDAVLGGGVIVHDESH